MSKEFRVDGGKASKRIERDRKRDEEKMNKSEKRQKETVIRKMEEGSSGERLSRVWWEKDIGP